jgi:hypothetical protein
MHFSITYFISLEVVIIFITGNSFINNVMTMDSYGIGSRTIIDVKIDLSLNTEYALVHWIAMQLI